MCSPRTGVGKKSACSVHTWPSKKVFSPLLLFPLHHPLFPLLSRTSFYIFFTKKSNDEFHWRRNEKGTNPTICLFTSKLSVSPRFPFSLPIIDSLFHYREYSNTFFFNEMSLLKNILVIYARKRNAHRWKRWFQFFPKVLLRLMCIIYSSVCIMLAKNWIDTIY